MSSLLPFLCTQVQHARGCEDYKRESQGCGRCTTRGGLRSEPQASTRGHYSQGVDTLWHDSRVGQNYIYAVHVRCFWQGKSPNMLARTICIRCIYGNYTVHIWCFWQGNHQICWPEPYVYDAYTVNIRCIYGVSAGKSPNMLARTICIRCIYSEYTVVHIWCFRQGNHQIYDRIRCVYIYGVHTVFWAGKSPNIRPYTCV